MKRWRKGLAVWKARNTLYISIPFTWLVNEALTLIKQHKGKSIVGGPGAVLMENKFEGLAEVKKEACPFEPIIYHNPFATFTTRGCPNKCPFCAVPKIEGKFREIKNFVPRPIICDNNFLASSKSHFDKVINCLKAFPYVDFNQGLEAKLFTPRKANRFCELKNPKIRFSFDDLSEEKFVVDAINLARKNGLNDISCYMIFGFEDTPAEALHKAKMLRELDVEIYPMRYEPLDAIEHGKYVAEENGWSDYELKRFKRYWWGHGLCKDSFENYDHRKALRNSDDSLGLIDKKKRDKLYYD